MNQIENQMIQYKEMSEKQHDNFNPEQFSGKCHINDKDLTQKRKNEDDDDDEDDINEEDKN